MCVQFVRHVCIDVRTPLDMCVRTHMVLSMSQQESNGDLSGLAV